MPPSQELQGVLLRRGAGMGRREVDGVNSDVKRPAVKSMREGYHDMRPGFSMFKEVS